jgi:hypothetical protein
LLPAPAPKAWETVHRQAVAILDAQRIPRELPLRLLAVFAQEGLRGPFRGLRRFSAINLDGFPFQWSVSLGNVPAAFRFITDCGIPGQSISERVAHTLARIEEVASSLGLRDSIAPLHAALEHLLADERELNASLMGLCIGVEVDGRGTPALKVYVNTETGDVTGRFERLSRCLTSLGRCAAAGLLHSFKRTFAGRLTPAFTALDLTSEGIGRVKLYFRPEHGGPELAARVAEAAGVGEAVQQFAPLHAVFLEDASYPAAAVQYSLEFPPDGHPIGIKFDLDVSRFLRCDADIDRRIVKLLGILNFNERPYRVMRDIVTVPLGAEQVRFLLFVGLALRAGTRRLNVYIHPLPPELQQGTLGVRGA